jgi:hypothetical protein
MSLPTFVIAGAQKCGTTTLHHLLGHHPQIFMTPRKEIHYFDWHWEEGLDWYSHHFVPRRRQHHAGESTPTYMYHAESRDRMVKTLPDVKLVIVLRNPTERAYSHYWHSRRKGFDNLLTFEEAIDSERRRTATDHIRRRGHFSYVDRGHYVEQLEALEDAIGRSQLHVLLLEDLINDQEAAVTAVLRFLGVRTRHTFGLRRLYGAPQRAVAARTSSFELSPHVASQNGTDSSGSEIARAGAYPPIDPSTRAQLIEHYRPYNDRLSNWLGRDVSHWNGVITGEREQVSYLDYRSGEVASMAAH